jgi:tRNA(Leu) C34 or U34 (ribose-2'-O)-methylase TrmL
LVLLPSIVQKGKIVRGYAAIGLDHPKNPANVGGVLRAVGCYDAAAVFMTGKRFSKAPTDVKKQWKHTPVIETEDLRLVIPFDCVPVAVDLIPGAKSLVDYRHPERAFYIFGAEDATLGERVLSWCRDVVYVPTNSCMNLAATVNVVLYDRMAKQRIQSATQP